MSRSKSTEIRFRPWLYPDPAGVRVRSVDPLGWEGKIPPFPSHPRTLSNNKIILAILAPCTYLLTYLLIKKTDTSYNHSAQKYIDWHTDSQMPISQNKLMGRRHGPLYSLGGIWGDTPLPRLFTSWPSATRFTPQVEIRNTLLQTTRWRTATYSLQSTSQPITEKQFN